ncbi:hypothetical protein MMYC01_207362 [Madurella mycetomatis]|uniref:Uncharacterized protein n=1 Tax=Madurella mycetomatis TaxID=100816 RepID=A0A175VYA0_9PEZI|nr:hypothetical protein MMYC01_207362 [Madurella mycetomatis]
MCCRKVYIHHRCGHPVTSLVEGCDGGMECPGVADVHTVTNKYPCVLPGCPFYGRFD